jgi:hypothetical protein
MAKQTCIVILNGHGYYKSTHIIDLSQSNVDYNIIFVDKIKKPVSNAQHNLLLNSLCKDKYNRRFTHHLYC